VQQPMWEGYDEWAHFAFIQHIAEFRTLPSRTDLVSPEVQRSLQLVPLSLAAAKVASGTITHDSFWRLAPEERGRSVFSELWDGLPPCWRWPTY